MLSILNGGSYFNIQRYTVNRIIPTCLVLQKRISICFKIFLDVKKRFGWVKKGNEIIKLSLKAFEILL